MGPSLAGFLYERFGWKVMGWTLVLISAMAVFPVVSFHVFAEVLGKATSEMC